MFSIWLYNYACYFLIKIDIDNHSGAYFGYLRVQSLYGMGGPIDKIEQNLITEPLVKCHLALVHRESRKLWNLCEEMSIPKNLVFYFTSRQALNDIWLHSLIRDY